MDVPTVTHKGLLVLVHDLGQGNIQATVINFSSEDVAATIQSKYLTPGAAVHEMFDDTDIGVVDELNSFPMTLGPYQGVPVILR